MTHAVVVAPIASIAVGDAAAAYEQSRTGYGPRFINAFEEVVHRLAVYPESSPVIDPGIRRALFPRPPRPFPFCVLYRIRHATIEIVDVLPTAANPARWHP